MFTLKLTASLLLACCSMGASAQRECNLDCPTDAPCVLGAFRPLPGDTLADEDDVGMHCQCPTGWTGVRCDRRYETCGDGGDVCYNGGACMPDGAPCDCHGARSGDGTRFAGKRCEISVGPQRLCPGGDPARFCLRGGRCNDDSSSAQICFCPEGTQGRHCEYESDDACDLDCMNGGECTLGVDPRGVRQTTPGAYCACPAGFGGEECEVERADCSAGHHCLNGGHCIEHLEIGSRSIRDKCDCPNFFTGKHCELGATATCVDGSFCVHGGTCGPAGEGCKCPSGYHGFRCEIETSDENPDDKKDEDILDRLNHQDHHPTSKCSEDLVCFNGGTCMDKIETQADGQVTKVHYCECTTAVVQNDSYTGPACQYRVTSTCGQDKFCANNGRCVDDGITECECEGPWGGDHCDRDRRSDPDHDDFQDVERTENCGDGSTCFHGGSCVETMVAEGGRVQTSVHCDCTRAAGKYTGAHCEHPATTVCGDDSEYCANHGTCKTDGSAGCDCPPAWTGLRCDIDNLKNARDEIAKQAQEDEDDDDVVANYNGNCGSHPCQNGGHCVLAMEGKIEFMACDCSRATTNTHVFAGEFCQYKSTSFCSQPENTGQSLNDANFCVNNGQCGEKPNDPCKCLTGYKGNHCEIPLSVGDDEEDSFMEDEDDDEYSKCHLQCANGSCVKGTQVSSKIHEIQHSGNLTARYDSEHVEHCQCRPGWAGLLCDRKIETCGEDEHFCLHGSKCVKSNDRHSCDCAAADQVVEGTTTFAGDSCEHQATEICSKDHSGVGHALAFCTNGGKCVAYVQDGEAHQGCTCPPEWAGIHCEVPDGVKTSESGNPVDDMFFLIVALVLLVVCGSLVYGVLRRRSVDPSTSCMCLRRRRVTKLSSYSEEEVNLAPRGGDNSLEMPETDYVSSSDPMVMSSSDLMQPPDDEPEVYIGPPIDEDGHELHNVEIL